MLACPARNAQHYRKWIWNLNDQKVEAGIKVQDHLWLQGKLKASLGYIRPILMKKKIQTNKLDMTSELFPQVV